MKALSVCLAALTLAACTSTSGVTITESRLAALKAEKATVQNVVTEFGQPNDSQLLPTGQRILTYSQAKMHFDPKSAIPVVGLFVNDSGYSTSSVSLIFGQDGTLASYSAQNMNFGGGKTTVSTGQ